MNQRPIIKKARQRAWLETRDVFAMAAAGLIGTVVAIIVANLIYP